MFIIGKFSTKKHAERDTNEAFFDRMVQQHEMTHPNAHPNAQLGKNPPPPNICLSRHQPASTMADSFVPFLDELRSIFARLQNSPIFMNADENDPCRAAFAEVDVFLSRFLSTWVVQHSHCPLVACSELVVIHSSGEHAETFGDISSAVANPSHLSSGQAATARTMADLIGSSLGELQGINDRLRRSTELTNAIGNDSWQEIRQDFDALLLRLQRMWAWRSRIVQLLGLCNFGCFIFSSEGKTGENSDQPLNDAELSEKFPAQPTANDIIVLLDELRGINARMRESATLIDADQVDNFRATLADFDELLFNLQQTFKWAPNRRCFPFCSWHLQFLNVYQWMQRRECWSAIQCCWNFLSELVWCCSKCSNIGRFHRSALKCEISLASILSFDESDWERSCPICACGFRCSIVENSANVCSSQFITSLANHLLKRLCLSWSQPG